MEDLAKVSGEKVFLVHISDAMNVPMEKLRTHHGYRTFPGEGKIDYAPVFKQLEYLGYRGAIYLEIWNQVLLKEDPLEVVRRGYESLLRAVLI